jgi:methyltransferase (TIGR00027 family)
VARRSRVGRTAGGATAIKAAEFFLPERQRLFTDPLAHSLVPAPLRWFLRVGVLRRAFIGAVEREAPGTYGGLVCRTRFVDDEVAASAAGGVRSVVIIGAGMDTRACRMPALADATIWEVDLPDVQAVKKHRLARVLGRLPPNVRFVPLELEDNALGERLEQSGFSIRSATLFVIEGVTQYVSLETLDSVFAFIASCAHGSRVVFTYVPQAIIDGRQNPSGAAATRHRMSRAGHPWLTGFDPRQIASWLGRFGLELTRDVDAAFYRELYLRPLVRSTPVFELERAGVAHVARRATQVRQL